jgi:glucose-6-phosphate isomerase
MTSLADNLRAEGYRHILLLGMGGSSLAPEVFSRTFEPAGLELSMLDSTDPGAVLAVEANIDLAKTLVTVATKSGGTVETLSFFKYFYNRMADILGEQQAGSHFVAITDPGSKLVDIANQYNFRDIFLNDPNIGGRYSALSFFGLLPATLAGVDVPRLLSRIQDAMIECAPETPTGENPGALLGALMGTLAQEGKDKITFVASQAISEFPNWAEQLIAESVGKEGKGILPVVGEPLGSPEQYGDDRVFVHLQVGADNSYTAGLHALEEVGHLVIHIQLQDTYNLGAQFFIWELATAVAGYFFSINPFDQPNVESAKILAREMVAAYSQTGELPASETTPPSRAALDEFLKGIKPGDYVALQAYLNPTPGVERLLQALRLEIGQRYKVATTLGFGPRFLHSTGQLHKGDAGNGFFIQFTSAPLIDASIPDEAGKPESAMSFNTLKLSQALGDAQALRQAGRRVISIPLGKVPEATLQELVT